MNPPPNGAVAWKRRELGDATTPAAGEAHGETNGETNGQAPRTAAWSANAWGNARARVMKAVPTAGSRLGRERERRRFRADASSARKPRWTAGRPAPALFRLGPSPQTPSPPRTVAARVGVATATEQKPTIFAFVNKCHSHLLRMVGGQPGKGGGRFIFFANEGHVRKRQPGEQAEQALCA